MSCWSRSAMSSISSMQIIPAKILQPVINIHSVQMVLSAHHLCMILSNLLRQLIETPLKAKKHSSHFNLIRHYKSGGQGRDHVGDYFWCFTRLNRNKLSPLRCTSFMTRPVMKSQESKHQMERYWFWNKKPSWWWLRCWSKSLLVIADELVWGYWLLPECAVRLSSFLNRNSSKDSIIWEKTWHFV